MQHSFDVEIAEQYGVNCAIILNNLQFWIAKNRANGSNFHDGKYWTYNSMKAFAELFPYMTRKQIRGALDTLRDEGILVTGNYNQKPFDRTLWYAFTEKGETLCPTGHSHLPDKANANDAQGTPIPDINTDTKTPDSKPDIKHSITPSGVETEFETLWDKYPRKEGKQAALKAYKKARKDGIPAETIEAGIDRYIAHIAAQKTERQYIKQGSTWFNGRCWEDEYSTGTSTNHEAYEEDMHKRWGAAADFI